MNALIKAGLVLAILLFAPEASYARDWRGIVPLRSTRADVVRIFNQCSDQREACAFSLDREDVFILFSGGLTKEYARCSRSLNPETVMFVQVEPRTKLKLDVLKIRKKTLEAFPSTTTHRDIRSYRSNDGLLVSTFGGTILQLFYLGAVPDEHPCARYYDEPELFIQTFVAHYTTVLIHCPSEAKAGSSMSLNAEAGIFKPKRGPTWSVSAGRIASGQHTYTIVVDTTGLALQTIQVTAEIADAFGHTATHTCRIQIVAE
ncbi:MAG TPA: hypothetical protein VJM12_20915 [Pyrinomonadaceae bacterium]|nr:hypothetical protein [Pyrinomonadaceae bacterium]